MPGFNTAGWKPAELTKVPDVPVQAHPNSGVREQELIVAKSRTNPKPGVYIYNIGQNLSGVVRFKVNGKKGQKITVRHGEFLNTDGTLYTTNLRAAKATDTYTLGKDGETICEPVFTFHGFQYVEITGVDEAPAAKDVKAVVYYSDLPKAGEFTSDRELPRCSYRLSTA
jgi:alpha-L-rhamnosidase